MTAVCGFKSNNRRIGSNQDLTTESGDSGVRPRAWDRDKTGNRKVLDKWKSRKPYGSRPLKKREINEVAG